MPIAVIWTPSADAAEDEWDAQLAQFGDDYHCIVAADAANDPLVVMDQHDLDTAILVGHAEGGETILRSSLDAPDRVAGLVLIDCRLTDNEVFTRLNELLMPALVIHGDQDHDVELVTGRLLADTLPNGEMAMIALAGHAPQRTHPDQVNPQIADFLARYA